MNYFTEEKKNIFISSYSEAKDDVEIQQFIQNSQEKKIIYLLPLKSLCNQLYHDYKDLDVGIITGERRLNIESNLLIMTPEILLQSIYKNEINREEIDWILFDKFQYINDTERGKNIEELLKFILPSIQILFYSLPFSNMDKLMTFIELISVYPFLFIEKKTKQLQNHFIYYDLHPSYYNSLPLSDTQNILQRIQKCIPLTQEVISKVYYDISNFKSLNGYIKKDYLMNKVLSECKEKEMFPAVCLVLSRRNLEKLVENLHISLLDETEKSKIEEECLKILRVLPNYENYIDLVEYKILLKLFKRGIGMHHAGMIPVLKELVEKMFENKYIKVIFSTETFLTSTFQQIQTLILTENIKFDGSEERVLNSSEYISYFQRMDKGNIIHLPNFYSLLDLDFFQLDTFHEDISYSCKFYTTIPYLLQNNFCHPLLMAKEFMDKNNELTTKGIIAREITEIFPLFIAEYFENILALSGKNMVCLLSCFLNINVNIYIPFQFSYVVDKELKDIITDVVVLMDNYEISCPNVEYYSCEYEQFGLNDNYYFYYYLLEYVDLWYMATNESEYKKVLNKIKKT